VKGRNVKRDVKNQAQFISVAACSLLRLTTSPSVFETSSSLLSFFLHYRNTTRYHLLSELLNKRKKPNNLLSICIMPPSRRSRRSNNLPQAPAAASDVTYKKGDIVEVSDIWVSRAGAAQSSVCWHLQKS
jgi:hypothetical protein